jgi:hypothetical protein
MSVLLDREIEVSENAVAVRRSWNPLTREQKSDQSRNAGRQSPCQGSKVVRHFGAVVVRAAESVASAIFLGIYFAISIGFTVLMLIAMLITLTCGLAQWH